MVYLDSSAIVKLVRAEPGTRELAEYLRSRPERVTSVVSAVEVPRAARRSTRSPNVLERVTQVIDRLDLVELDLSIIARAAALQPAALRSLDAIHIATALELAADLEALVTYDGRQSSAAVAVGLSVVSPGA